MSTARKTISTGEKILAFVTNIRLWSEADFPRKTRMSALGQEVSEGSCGLLTKEKAAFAGGRECGAAFKSGKGLGTLNALAPYVV